MTYALVAQLVEQLICNHNPPNYLTRTCYSSNKYYHHLSKKDSVIFIIDIPTVCRQIAIYESKTLMFSLVADATHLLLLRF